MTRYEYSGDRDKGIEWAERDETMDRRSTSRNTIASASRRIVCLALISAPELSILFLIGRGFFLSQRSSLTFSSRPVSFFFLSVSFPSSLFPNLAAGGILLLINFAKVTLITAEFYLSRLASTSQSRTPANFFFSSYFRLTFALLSRGKTQKRERLRWAQAATNHIVRCMYKHERLTFINGK